MRPLATEVAWSVCVCVERQIDRAAVRVVDSGRPKEPCSEVAAGSPRGMGIILGVAPPVEMH